jgi:hypothetical protein
MHKNENLRFLIASLVERSYDIESNLPQIEVNRLHAALDELRQLETQLQRITLPHIKPEDLACKHDDDNYAEAEYVRRALEFCDDIATDTAIDGAIHTIIINLERALGKPEAEGAEHPIPDGWHAFTHEVPDASEYWIDPKTGEIVCGVDAEPVSNIETSELPDNPVVVVRPDSVPVPPEVALQTDVKSLVDNYTLPAVAEALANTLDDMNESMTTMFNSPKYAQYCGELCGNLRNFVAACVNTKHGKPQFSHEAWQDEVATNGTTMGFHDWVAHRTRCFHSSDE